MAIELMWHGPYSFLTKGNAPCVFDDFLQVTRLQGVYLWTVPFERGILVYYVGKTSRSFRVRFHREEYPSFHKGLFHLPHSGLFEQGVLEHIYEPRNSKEAHPDFDHRYPELKPHIDSILTSMRLFVAPLNENNTTSLKDLERAVMWDVWNAGGRCRQFISNGARDYGAQRPALNLHHSSDGQLWGLTGPAPDAA